MSETDKRDARDFADCDGFIAIMAFRYALGRRTAAVSHCVRFLEKNIDRLGETSCRNIIDEIEDARECDDGERGEPSKYPMLGDGCDRAEWLRLRDKVKARYLAHFADTA